MAWALDKAHSQIGFAVRHMMISTVRGRFKDFEAKLDIDDSDLTHSYLEGTVKTASIETEDVNRDAHLRSPDFFEADKYPTMTFKSTRIEKVGDDHYHVVGDLTIKDVTRQITFDTREEGRGKDPWGKQHIGFSAQASINRRDYGLNWNVVLETGGWLVHEQVRIEISLEVAEVQETPAAAATAEPKETAQV